MKHLGEILLEIMATCTCFLPEMTSGLNSHNGSNYTVEVQRIAVNSLGGQ